MYFQSIREIYQQFYAKYAESLVTNVLVYSESIVKLLNQLNVYKASGPDNQSKFVKQLLTQVAPALAMTLNLLSQQKIPDDCCKSYNSYLKTR